MELCRLEIKESERVYPVSEDTTLLAEAIVVEKGQRFLEIGCGTGYITLLAARCGARAEGVDINPDAVSLARENAQRNGMDPSMFWESDMFSEVSGTYDVIAFNPPYLPAEEFESTSFDACWDGGADGRQVTARFIGGLDKHLAEGARAYLLLSSLSSIGESMSQLHRAGFAATECSELSLFFEKLVVVEIRREK